MAYNDVKSLIDSEIHHNEQQYITGDILNGVLTAMLNWASGLIGDEEELQEWGDLIEAVNDLETLLGQTTTPNLNDVAVQGAVTSVKIKGSTFFENKDPNDFAQFEDLMQIFETENLPDADNLQGDEWVRIRQGGDSKRITIQDLAEFLGGSNCECNYVIEDI